MEVDIEQVSGLAEAMSKLLQEIYVKPTILLFVCIILLISFIVRYVVRVASTKVDKKVKKRFRIYVLAHCLLDYLIAIVITYLIIIITRANPSNYSINYLISPILGFILSILIDHKFIVPFENTNGDKFNPLLEKKESKESSSNININVNTAPVTKKDIDESSSILDTTDFITDEQVDSDDFDNITKDTLNILLNRQRIIDNKINDQGKNISDMHIMIDAIRDSIKCDKKFSLKRMIYTCLDQGYATPDQDEMIQSDYANYTALNGNGEIKRLFENRYMKLPVHSAPTEDDRYDRRREKRATNKDDMVLPPNSVTIIDNRDIRTEDIIERAIK